VIIALLDDKISDVFDRIPTDYRAGANVVVGETSGGLASIVMRRDESPEAADVPFGSHPDDCPIGLQSDVEMLLAHLVLQRDISVRCASQAYEMESDVDSRLSADLVAAPKHNHPELRAITSSRASSLRHDVLLARPNAMSRSSYPPRKLIDADAVTRS
jgi:hypothetical protein